MEVIALMDICNWLENELESYSEKWAYNINEPKHKKHIEELEKCITDLKKNIISNVKKLSKELNYEAN